MCYFLRLAGVVIMVCLALTGMMPEKNVIESPCRLCEYQGLHGNDRLGLLLISSGRIMEIALPGYEKPNGETGEQKTGSFSMSTGKAAQGLNHVTVIVHAGEGRARISADIAKKIKPDKTALKKQYCSACIDKVKNVRTDMLLIDLHTKDTYPVGQNGIIRIRAYEVESYHEEGSVVMDIRQ